MRTILKNVFVLLLFGLLAQALSGSDGYISFDFPGAVNTQATAINPAGAIVGRYINADGQQHGFLLLRGKFQTIEPPGSMYAEVNWINPEGQMVGSYRLADGKTHGFVLSRGQFTTIDYPGASGTILGGIAANGVGRYHSPDGGIQALLGRHDWASHSEAMGLFLFRTSPDLRELLTHLFSIGRVIHSQMKRQHLLGLPSSHQEIRGGGI